MEYSAATINQAEIIKEIIDAVLKGGIVQIHKESAWCDTGEDPDLMLLLQYPCRVKPEPKYVPFDFSDAKDLIGKSIIYIDKDQLDGVHQIFSVKGDYVYFWNGGCNMKFLFKYCTFLDGSPCGKLSNK